MYLWQSRIGSLSTEGVVIFRLRLGKCDFRLVSRNSANLLKELTELRSKEWTISNRAMPTGGSLKFVRLTATFVCAYKGTTSLTTTELSLSSNYPRGAFWQSYFIDCEQSSENSRRWRSWSSLNNLKPINFRRRLSINFCRSNDEHKQSEGRSWKIPILAHCTYYSRLFSDLMWDMLGQVSTKRPIFEWR